MDTVIDVYFEKEIVILAATDELDEERVREVLETNSVEVSKVAKTSG